MAAESKGLSKADKGRRAARVVLGVVTLLLAAAIAVYVASYILVYACIEGASFSIEDWGMMLVPAAALYVTGFLAIAMYRSERTGPVVCTVAYSVCYVILRAFSLESYEYYGQKLLILCTALCLVFGSVIWLLSCRSLKRVLISLAAILGVLFLSTRGYVIWIELETEWAEQKVEEEKKKKEEEKQKKEEEKKERMQAYANRTPEKIAEEYLSNRKGISKNELIWLLEMEDGLDTEEAEQTAGSIRTDWNLQALYSAIRMYKARSGAIYIYDEVFYSDAQVDADDSDQEAREKIRENLTDHGFTESEVGYALENLDNEHISDFESYENDLESSAYFATIAGGSLDLGSYYEYYLDDSMEAELVFLDVSAGTLQPAFSPDILQYTVTGVINDQTAVISIPENAAAEITVLRNENAESGEQEITVKVLSTSGKSRREYHICQAEEGDNTAENAETSETTAAPDGLTGPLLSGRGIEITVFDMPEEIQIYEELYAASANVNGRTIKCWSLKDTEYSFDTVSPGYLVFFGKNGQDKCCLYSYDFTEKTLQRYFYLEDGSADAVDAEGRIISEPEDEDSEGVFLSGKAVTVTVLDPEGIGIKGFEITEILLDGLNVKGFVQEDIEAPEYINLCGMDDRGGLYCYCYDFREKTLQKNYESSGNPDIIERDWLKAYN